MSHIVILMDATLQLEFATQDVEQDLGMTTAQAIVQHALTVLNTRLETRLALLVSLLNQRLG